MKKHGFDPENPPFVDIYSIRCPDPRVINRSTGIFLLAPYDGTVLLYCEPFLMERRVIEYYDNTTWLYFRTVEKAKEYMKGYYKEEIIVANRQIKDAEEMLTKVDALKP